MLYDNVSLWCSYFNISDFYGKKYILMGKLWNTKSQRILLFEQWGL